MEIKERIYIYLQRYSQRSGKLRDRLFGILLLANCIQNCLGHRRRCLSPSSLSLSLSVPCCLSVSPSLSAPLSSSAVSSGVFFARTFDSFFFFLCFLCVFCLAKTIERIARISFKSCGNRKQKSHKIKLQNAKRNVNKNPAHVCK